MEILSIVLITNSVDQERRGEACTETISFMIRQRLHDLWLTLPIGSQVE